MTCTPSGAVAPFVPGNEGVFTIPEFVFDSGERLRGLKIGYVTHGALNKSKDNVILLVPGTSNTRHSADGYIGSGKAFDTDRYFIVAVDAIGGGTSSQPADGLGADFPQYTVRDMVRAQHDLMRNAFGLGPAPLKAVAGGSMGAFQALEWAIHFPEAAESMILMVPAVCAGKVFKAAVRMMIEIISLDRRWQGGRYVEQPVDGVRTAGMHYFPWTVTDAYIESIEPEALEAHFQAHAASFARWDAWSLIRRYQASSSHDVSAPFDGDMARALGRIRARTLILPASTDRLLGTEGAREIARQVKTACYEEVPTLRGHLGWRPVEGSAETRFITERIRRFVRAS